MLIREPGLAECGRRKGIRGEGGYVSRGRKKRRGKKFVWRNKKKSMKRRMMAPRRLELLFFFFFYLVLLPERDRDSIYIYIYIHSVQRISNGVDVGGSILSFMQGKSTTPLFRKAKCYSRIVLGETLLLIFKFEDGKVARERGPPPQERMGQMNEWERERYEGAGLLANNQNGWLIQMESGYT